MSSQELFRRMGDDYESWPHFRKFIISMNGEQGRESEYWIKILQKLDTYNADKRFIQCNLRDTDDKHLGCIAHNGKYFAILINGYGNKHDAFDICACEYHGHFVIHKLLNKNKRIDTENHNSTGLFYLEPGIAKIYGETRVRFDTKNDRRIGTANIKIFILNGIIKSIVIFTIWRRDLLTSNNLLHFEHEYLNKSGLLAVMDEEIVEEIWKNASQDVVKINNQIKSNKMAFDFTFANDTRCCSFCGITSTNDLKTCKGCLITVYCSKKCQKLDWKREHQYYCKRHRMVKYEPGSFNCFKELHNFQ